jgi:hypothetical protein
MSRRRSPLFWLLLAVFAAGLVVWSLYIPYRPELLYRAIPAGASVVTAHRGLDVRWNDLTANPVMSSLLTSLDADVEEIRQLGRDEEFRGWLAKLAGDEVVAAFLPRWGREARPVWVFASWLGGRSQRLRWLLSTGRLPGFQRIYDHAGRPVWMVRARWLKGHDVLTVSLTDGMLVACLSARGADMAGVLKALDGDVTSYADWRGRVETFARLRADHPDRGWMAHRDAPGGGFFFGLRDVRAGRLEGWMDAAWLAPQSPASSDGLAVHEVASVLGERPLAVIWADGRWAKSALEPVTNAVWKHMLALWATNRVPGDVGLALLGGEFSGRLQGIKIPTLLAALDLGTSNALSAGTLYLDRINARTRWGLVPHVEEIPPYTVIVCEGTSDNLYASLDSDEQVAFTSAGSWLLVGSNLRGLTNLITAAAGEENAKMEQVATNAALSGWVDLEEGGKAVRMAIAAYTLKLMFSDPEGSKATRARMNEVKAWIDALSPLKVLRFSLAEGDRGPRLDFQAGRADADGLASGAVP